ncbi:MAG: thiamine-phosphate kinase [SAR86 cluster bacterium]|nr:thiamine-phosphate kinase [SAR86 cluster bacterium]
MTVQENHLIQKYFNSLKNEASSISIGIGDDCAEIKSKDTFLTSVDTSLSGTHFPEDLDPFYIAYRSLVIASSDIYAMGGIPHSFLLSITHPNPDDEWFKKFSCGTQEFINDYKVSIAGGDLTQGPLSISVTFFGDPLPRVLKRSNAKLNDHIYITGKIGEGYQGLTKFMDYKPGNNFLKPKVPKELVEPLNPFINACIDISDGLLIDLERICNASGVGAQIKYDKSFVVEGLADLVRGDDYQLCFTANSNHHEQIKKISQDIFCIGEITSSNKVSVFDGGKEINFKTKGWESFSLKNS